MPAERLALEALPGLLPPVPPVVEAPLGQPARALDDLRVASERVATRGKRPDQAGRKQDDGGARRPLQQEPLALRTGPVAHEVRRREREAGAEHEQEREPRAVVHANRARLRVLGDPGQLDRDSEQETGGDGRRHERRRPLEPLP